MSSLSKQDINNRFVELKSARKVGFMNSTWNWVNVGFTDLDTYCILFSVLQRQYLMVSKWFSIYCTGVSTLRERNTETGHDHIFSSRKCQYAYAILSHAPARDVNSCTWFICTVVYTPTKYSLIHIYITSFAVSSPHKEELL